MKVTSHVGKFCLLLLVATHSAHAEEPVKPADAATEKDNWRAAATRAIVDSAEAFMLAYNKHDAEAIGPLFLERAEFVDGDGNVFRGRKEIQEEFAAYFKDAPQAEIELEVKQVKVLTPSLAVERGVCYYRPEKTAAVTQNAYLAVHVKTDAGWRLATVTNDQETPSTTYDHLKPLEWLIGEWVDEGQDSLVTFATRWDRNRRFIIREFSIKIRGVAVIDGVERIGYDPLTKQIKSWIFDSEGGHGTAIWTPDGEGWIVKVSGVRSDGSTTSSTRLIEKVDNDTMRALVTDRVVAGKREDDARITIVRKAPPPK